MPPKKHLPAPIDRPLSRAYLREFTGWSTEYPPGASDPTSLRIMENLLVNRRGSVRIRPGLRHVTWNAAGTTPLHPDLVPCSSHEAFYLNDGKKAYLFAVRDPAFGGVTFRVGIYNPDIDPGGFFDYGLFTNTLAGAGFDLTEWAPSQPAFTSGTTYVKFLQIDNKILALSNNGEQLIVFHVGATKKVMQLDSIEYPSFGDGTSMPWTGVPRQSWIDGPQTTSPYIDECATSPSAGGLWSTEAMPNNFGVFYTYSSELGESAASDVAVGTWLLPWGGWSWREPITFDDTQAPVPDELSPPVSNPTKAVHQMVVRVNGPGAGFEAARDAGATRVNFYLFTWSNQDSVPVEAMLVGTKEITPASVASDAYIVLNPSTRSLGVNAVVPNVVNRYNSTRPSRAGNGLVAADRLVLVYDPTAAAVIRWTTNEQGNYLNFSPAKGGGYKTLTSGNMQIPAAVKLWQNPQSADTITILNKGTDSHSTAYYMAPAQVASQSDATNIMGFEETTATPGTTSPFGVEVANNALYHPLDTELMKSTASNYNINHKAMTDMIASDWAKLINKDRIVSCLHDGRLYYLVHNPDGAALEAHCNGNEVWVLDTAAEGGSWSRWTVQGVSLRKMELNGRVLMSLSRPDGIFVFDPDFTRDQVIGGELGNEILDRYIPWRLETNTQGANRAHDAWAHLQQVQVTLGNFLGRMRWGIRGWDQYGTVIEMEKKTRGNTEGGPDDGLPFDLEDQLLVARAMKEWVFFASSIETDGVIERSFGQVTLVQYRYAPVSVNVGYEYGSVETFEYGRDAAWAPSSYSDNGVPAPFNDQGRP